MNLGSPGLAIDEFSSLVKDNHSFEASIFLRDASEHILPTWEWGQERIRPQVSLTPDSDDLAAWMIQLLSPLGIGGRDELTELVSQFCDVLASRLVLWGEVYLEVVPGQKGENYPAGLVLLPSWKVRRVPGAYLQLVPAPDRSAIGRRWTRIPSKRIHLVALPTILGTPREQRRLIRSLDRVPSRPPDWAVEGWSIRAKSTQFDYETFKKAQRLEIERALSRWGSMSYGNAEGKTDYFQISRVLLHFRARAALRGTALDALNYLISRTGSSSRLECSGLPEPADFDTGLAKLWAGELSLSDGLKIAGI